MYDPTVFENLKVSFENHIYDLDNLERQIEILNRKDRVELATLKRSFSIEFSLIHRPAVTVEVRLDAPLKELADEILEKEETVPGCFLSLRVWKYVEKPEEQCEKIAEILQEIWEDDMEYKQTISFVFGQREKDFLDTIDIDFHSKLTEEQIREIREFLQYVLKMLEQLSKV